MDCDFELHDDYELTNECPLVYKGYTNEVRAFKRLEKCPILCEVSEPHGDLIDRDALPTPRVEWEDIVNAPTIIQASEDGK